MPFDLHSLNNSFFLAALYDVSFLNKGAHCNDGSGAWWSRSSYIYPLCWEMPGDVVLLVLSVYVRQI